MRRFFSSHLSHQWERRSFSILSKKYNVEEHDRRTSGIRKAEETRPPTVAAPAAAQKTVVPDEEEDTASLNRQGSAHPSSRFDFPIREPTADVLFPRTVPFAQPDEPRSSLVTLIGIPNSGKSTLTNALVNNQVSIVTRKAQTTRDRVLAVLSAQDTQLVFQDTPGVVHAPLVPRRRKNVQKQIAGVAMEAASDADTLVCVVDGARRPDADLTALLDRVRGDIQGGDDPVAVERSILVVNKMDLCGARAAQRRADELMLSNLFATAFCVSALHDGPDSKRIDQLRCHLLDMAQPGPWLFNPNVVSDLSDVERAEEVVRGNLYKRINQELPYSVVQRTDGWTPVGGGGLRIDQTLLVPNERVKRILIGHSGRTIRQINMSAREQLSEMFGRPVQLFLYVRAKQS